MAVESININTRLVRIMSGKPNSNTDNNMFMYTGRYRKSDLYRILVDIPLELPHKNISIVKASLKFKVNILQSVPCLFNTYAIYEEWDIKKVNWHNQPRFSSEEAGPSIYINQSGSYEFDITMVVLEWHRNKLKNFGIVIKNDENYDRTLISINNNIGPQVAPPILNVLYSLEDEHKEEFVKFVEKTEELRTINNVIYSCLINTSLAKTVTFFIVNVGGNPVTVNAQISPDGHVFIDDSYIPVVQPGKCIAIVPAIFSKFTRIALRNTNKDSSSYVKIYYQAQQ